MAVPMLQPHPSATRDAPPQPACILSITLPRKVTIALPPTNTPLGAARGESLLALLGLWGALNAIPAAL